MNKQKPMRRGAGVLLPVFSLPSAYGIGTFGKAAYDFVDFLRRAGQKYWQVLPLGPTGYGDSPYQSFSAFAGNHYFIDLDLLIKEGLLTAEEVKKTDWESEKNKVDYGIMYEKRRGILSLAFSRANLAGRGDYENFCAENSYWLPGYCAFMAKRGNFPPSFWAAAQFYFFAQWARLKAYANKKNIEIIGDIPIYAAPDCADLSDHPEAFLLDEDGRPTFIAGVPPDGFSSEGQLWGNPLYDWAHMEESGFEWWKERLRHSRKLYDALRIDHFIGLNRYYKIPAGKTAKDGSWALGPGMKLFEAIDSVMDGKYIIAEDLGEVTDETRLCLRETGYPGMRPMIYAFNSDGTHEFLPCNFAKNLVCYGGTHDNETLSGYFLNCSQKERDFAREYLNVKTDEEIAYGLIRAGYASSANLAIFQLQDFLGLGNEARINTPASADGQNWRWRMKKNQPGSDCLTDGLAIYMKRLCEVYGR